MKIKEDDELYAVLSYREYAVPLRMLDALMQELVPCNVDYNGHVTKVYDKAETSLRLTRKSELVACMAKQALEVKDE